jgi:hypothetical protein
MDGRCNRKRVRALLVLMAIFSSGAAPSVTVRGPRAARTRAAAEPFATFHLLDRHLSLLSQQSAALQKRVDPSPRGSAKSTQPVSHSDTRRMGQTVAAIDKLALRLKRRYRRKPFAVRLFGRLHARAAAVKSSLRTLNSASTPARAASASSNLDKRIVALGLQYNAISGGYAALQCAPGEWTCCEPRRQQEGKPPDACRWVCTKQTASCRGFVGARAGQK